MGFVNLPIVTQATTVEELRDAINQVLLYISTAPRISAAALFDSTVAAPVATTAQNINKNITKFGVGLFRLTFESPYVGRRYGVDVQLVSTSMLCGQAFAKTETYVDIQIVTLAGVAADCVDCFVVITDIPA